MNKDLKNNYLFTHSDNYEKLKEYDGGGFLPYLKMDDYIHPLNSLNIICNDAIPATEKIITGIKLKKEERFIEYEKSDWSWLVYFDLAEYVYVEESIFIQFCKEQSIKFQFKMEQETVDRLFWKCEDNRDFLFGVRDIVLPIKFNSLTISGF